jgi:predicted nucleic acid-binding protein
MTRFAIDAPTAVRLLEDGVDLPAEHALVAPALLKSQVLERLFQDVRDGRRDERQAQELLRGLATMRIRLLSDRVSRGTAWRIATELRLPVTWPAEYLAVTRLQADVLVTEDEDLLRAAEAGGVPTTASATLLA